MGIILDNGKENRIFIKSDKVPSFRVSLNAGVKKINIQSKQISNSVDTKKKIQQSVVQPMKLQMCQCEGPKAENSLDCLKRKKVTG